MEELINKYLIGVASEEELLELERWVHLSNENRRAFSNAVNIAAISTRTNPTCNDAKDLYKILLRLKKRERRVRAMRLFATISVAASIVLIISIYAISKIESYKSEVNYILAQTEVTLQYSTPYGTKSKILLPDSSIVWLNSGSNIRFSSKFSNNSRDIYFSGEGFFDIVQDSLRPMNVITPQGLNVKVLGTKFNLSAYVDDNDISIMLLSGKVEVESPFRGDKLSILPSERYIIDNKSAQYSVNVPVNTLPILGWKEGWLIFDDTSLNSVFKTLKRVYGVEFIIKDKSILSQTLSAKFKDESLTQVLDLMNKVSLIEYSIEENIVTISRYK